jgi:RNA polymerase sigma-70 factor (ECF subfamily)
VPALKANRRASLQKKEHTVSHTRSEREDAASLSISTAATFPGTSADPAQADIDMILQMAKKDQDAFEQLYRRLYRPVLSISRSILRNAEDAEEAAADAILEAWRRAESFKPEAGTLFTWVMMIARCRAIDRLRSKSRRREESLDSFCDLASSSMDPEQIEILRQRAKILRRAMTALPEKQRDFIQLAYFEGMTHSEIAAHRGVPLGSAKTRLRLAILKLRKILDL